jgi:hypothetical protein
MRGDYHRGTEAQRHRGTEAQRKAGRGVFNAEAAEGAEREQREGIFCFGKEGSGLFVLNPSIFSALFAASALKSSLSSSVPLWLIFLLQYFAK